MTRPGIEPQSPGPLANTQLFGPMDFNLLIGLVGRVNWLIGLLGRVFANGPGHLGSIPGHVIPMTLKMLLDTYLLNTQQYKVHIKGKVDQSWERSSALPSTLV